MEMILKNEERAVFALRKLYQQYGYLPYKMSRFEEYDLYVRNKDFLVSDQVITFADRNGKLLALKPDVTLSIIKNSPDNKGVVQKLYNNENVYREDPASHTIKEIMQTGLECVGDLGSYEIAEVALLAARSLELLGRPFVLDISHMGLVAAVLDACGFSGEDRKTAIRCLRQKNPHELMRLSAALPEASRDKLRLLVSIGGEASRELKALNTVLTTREEKNAFNELERLCGILERNGYGDAIRVDFSVGNDMKYYSGVVFKGYLEGIPTSVLSGGQYDKLLRKMGRSSSAIGFAIYVDLLERLDKRGDSFDIDTVLLHDGSVNASALLRAAEAAAHDGSVLVTTSLPEGRTWRKLLRFENGKVV